MDEKSIENGLEGQKFLVVCLFWGGCHHPNVIRIKFCFISDLKVSCRGPAPIKRAQVRAYNNVSFEVSSKADSRARVLYPKPDEKLLI